jgi:hypothetical protein
MSLEVKTGDLVKLIGSAEHRFSASFGTVVGMPPSLTDGRVNVMMYTGGLGQFTEWIHTTLLELVFPVGKL